MARSASIDVAVDLAKAIVVSCKGYHVGISILDAAGTPKLYYIPDGTGGTHAYTGYRKANTALAFKMPSGKVAAAAQADPAIVARLAADANNYVTWAGGVLIMAGTEVIGAVGVSGAEPSAKDEACALDGLKKVQSPGSAERRDNRRRHHAGTVSAACGSSRQRHHAAAARAHGARRHAASRAAGRTVSSGAGR